MNKQEINSMTVASDERPDQLEQLLRIHERIARLLREIDRLPETDKQNPDRGYTEYYNQLRTELHDLEADSYVANIIPKRLSHLRAWHFTVIVVAPAAVMGAAALLLAPYAEGASVGFGLFAFFWSLMTLIWVLLGSDFRPTILQVRERSSLLLAHAKESIGHLSPQVAVQLQDYPTIGKGAASSEQSPVVESNLGDSDATAKVKAKSTPSGGHRPLLTRRHLETQLYEQKRCYDQLTERIATVTEDEGREMDGERKLLLKARRDRIVAEREEVANQLREIERQLVDVNPTSGT